MAPTGMVLLRPRNGDEDACEMTNSNDDGGVAIDDLMAEMNDAGVRSAFQNLKAVANGFGGGPALEYHPEPTGSCNN